MSRTRIIALGLLGLWLSFGTSKLVRAADEPSTHSVAVEADTHAAASGAGEHGPSSEGGQPDILEFKPSMAIATVIVFLTLLGILWKYAWGPLSKALDEREHLQEDVVRRAEEAKAESERLLAEHRAQMLKATDQVQAIIAEAKRDAESLSNGIIQKAQAEANESKLRAERDIGTARDQALQEIWTKTADLAVSVAGRVISKELKPDDHRRLLDVAINELPQASVPNGQGSKT